MPAADKVSAAPVSDRPEQTHSQFFRANVGIVVLNPAGRVLALERFGHAGTWQMPQGGLDVGEEPVEAAYRELAEETGLQRSQVELVGEHPEWLAYELDVDKRKRDTGRGQVQKWFVFRLLDSAATINITRVDPRKGTQEFTAYDWMSFDELLAKAVAFRVPVYRRVAEYARAVGA